MSLKSAINGDDSAVSQWFAICIQVLIALSLVCFSFETLPNLSDDARHWLRLFEVFTIAIFSLEYLLRLWARACLSLFLASI